jgi:hypothetical protein
MRGRGPDIFGRSTEKNQRKGDTHGKRNSVAVNASRARAHVTYSRTIEMIGETQMQTEIEILETRETPTIVWY